MEADIFEYHKEEDSLDTESFQGMFAKTIKYPVIIFSCYPFKSISLIRSILTCAAH